MANGKGGINARFWVWHKEGYVKLTLRPGQSLSKYWSCPGDEGYAFGSEMWVHEGDRVVCSWWDRATDCDGRQDSDMRLICPLHELSSVQALRYHGLVYSMPLDLPLPVDGVYKPAWELEDESQRDYSAEAMNY